MNNKEELRYLIIYVTLIISAQIMTWYFLAMILFPDQSARGDLLETTPEEAQAELQPVSDPVLECAERLFNQAGRGGDHVPDLVKVYRKASQDPENVDFMQYVLSVIYQESKFNRTAVSHADAYGLMQMTLPAVQDSIRHCNLKPLSDMTRLHDSYTNVKYGTCYLKKLFDEMEGDWTRVLIAYNGGYKQLQKYDKGETITHETSNYVLLVNRALQNICRNKGEK